MSAGGSAGTGQATAAARADRHDLRIERVSNEARSARLRSSEDGSLEEPTGGEEAEHADAQQGQ
jgi:hypothetical protein